MQKSLHIEPAKCTGCLQCEMACSYENYGVFNPAKSRIKVFDFHHTGRKVPYTCTQCEEAWCMHACPVEAALRLQAFADVGSLDEERLRLGVALELDQSLGQAAQRVEDGGVLFTERTAPKPA